MCVGCGGTCRQPRFTTPIAPPMGVRPTAVGTAQAPGLIPDALVRPSGPLLTYESVWAGRGPTGEPVMVTVPGTYGQHATRAGRR